MGRDRDPFDRTLESLRRRLVERGPLQGAALSVKGLSAELGVSPTPVREALSRLAGEGLVARTPVGYAGVVHDSRSLAELYGLAQVLAEAALRAIPREAAASAPDDLADAGRQCCNRVLGEALALTLAQLAPFAPAEAALLIEAPGPWTPARARRAFRRRVQRADEILRRALVQTSRI